MPYEPLPYYYYDCPMHGNLGIRSTPLPERTSMDARQNVTIHNAGLNLLQPYPRWTILNHLQVQWIRAEQRAAYPLRHY